MQLKHMCRAAHKSMFNRSLPNACLLLFVQDYSNVKVKIDTHCISIVHQYPTSAYSGCTSTLHNKVNIKLQAKSHPLAVTQFRVKLRGAKGMLP